MQHAHTNTPTPTHPHAGVSSSNRWTVDCMGMWHTNRAPPMVGGPLHTQHTTSQGGPRLPCRFLFEVPGMGGPCCDYVVCVSSCVSWHEGHQVCVFWGVLCWGCVGGMLGVDGCVFLSLSFHTHTHKLSPHTQNPSQVISHLQHCQPLHGHLPCVCSRHGRGRGRVGYHTQSICCGCVFGDTVNKEGVVACTRSTAGTSAD